MLRNDSLALDYFIKLSRRHQDVFTQFIDIFIETKQNYILDLFNHLLVIRWNSHFSRLQEMSRIKFVKSLDYSSS